MFIIKTRVEGKSLNQHTSLLWHHIRGLGDKDAPENEYVVPIHTKATDLHTECKQWASRGECRKNPNYMARKCRVSCGLSEWKAQEL